MPKLPLIMSTTKRWTLTQNNTSPFILVAFLYCFIVGLPFVYFLYLKGQTHESQNTGIVEFKVPAPTQHFIDSIQHIPELALLAEDTIDALERIHETRQSKRLANWQKFAESRQFLLVTRLAVFSIVFAFGAIGAAVSLITRARNRIAIGNVTALELISIQTVGGIFSCILFLLFLGEFISGRLFPNPHLEFSIIYVHPAFAKLLVWAFIAGFFERFVPDMLNNFAKQAQEQSGKVQEQI